MISCQDLTADPFVVTPLSRLTPLSSRGGGWGCVGWGHPTYREGGTMGARLIIQHLSDFAEFTFQHSVRP
ncbi:MAG: hypothetical protein OHK005_13700 [Candidatus Methylacidiphilales bacterium]